MQPIVVHTFYDFTPIAQPQVLQAPILAQMKALDVRGTITLAEEGVNATISGVTEGVDALLAMLRVCIPAARIAPRTSNTISQPFQRSKVKVKRELISLGQPAHPAQCVGEYVSPASWNALITQPDVITIDSRNDYEFELGHFAGAVNPGTRHFKQMVAWTQANVTRDKHQRIAMYCTGGIRCEKYSSYLVSLGFTHIYHLRGGILGYLQEVPANESLWQGKCFVFDERMSMALSSDLGT